MGTMKQQSQPRRGARGVVEPCRPADLRGDLARLELWVEGPGGEA